MSLILGIDASALRLGWAVSRTETGHLLACGCERIRSGGISRGLVHVGKPETIRRALDAVAIAPGDDVSVVAFEWAFTRPGGFTGIIAGMAVGQVVQAASRRWPDAELWALRPTEWRKEAGLPYRAPKEEVTRFALEELGAAPIVEHPDLVEDACDAAVITRAVWEMCRRGEVAA